MSELTEASVVDATQLLRGTEDERVFLKNPYGEDSSSGSEEVSLSGGSGSLLSINSVTSRLLQGDLTADDTISLFSRSSKASGAPPNKKRPTLRISSMLVILVLACLSLLIVGCLAVVPSSVISSKDGNDDILLLLEQNGDSFSALTQRSLDNLPFFIRSIRAFYFRTPVTDSSGCNLPSSSQELMETFIELYSQFRYTIKYIRFSFTGNNEINQMYVSVERRQEFDPTTGEFYNITVAAHSNQPLPAPEYYVNTTSMKIDASIASNSTYDFLQSLTSSDGAYNRIAVPWQMTGSTVRWITDLASTDSIYFKYVIPVEVDGAIGYFEVGLPSVNVVHGTIVIENTLGKRGLYVIFDAEREVIIINNFRKPSVVPTLDDNGKVYYKEFFFNESENIYFNYAIAAVKDRGGFKALFVNTSIVRLKLSFNRENILVQIRQLNDNFGLHFFQLHLVLKSDFDDDFLKARYTAIGVSVGVIVLGAVAAVFIAVWASGPQKRLIPDLERVSRLDFQEAKKDGTGERGFWRGVVSGDYIPEIAELRAAFAVFMRNLSEMRSYLPTALGAKVDADTDPNAFSEAATGRTTADILSKRLNTFTEVECTVVVFCLRADVDGEVLSHFMSVLGEACEEQRGNVDELDHSMFFFSFGGHTMLTSHPTRAATFVLEAMGRLWRECPGVARNVYCFLSTDTFTVGTCGTERSKSCVVGRKQEVERLVRVLCDLDCHIATTTPPNYFTGAMQWVPVERIRRSDGVDSTVYEGLFLRDTYYVGELRSDKECFVEGFAALTRNDVANYKKALEWYSRVSLNCPSTQGRRLAALCESRLEERCVHFYPGLDLYEGLLRRAERPAGEPSADTTPASSEGVVATEVGGSTGTAGSGFFLSFEREEEEAAGETGADAQDSVDVPLEFSDHSGKTWRRSYKEISSGAFASVYVALDDRGHQVALKCLLRKRRDISQEALEKELATFSKLQHRNIIKYLSFCVTPNCLALVMEYAPGHSLHEALRGYVTLEESVVRRFMTDVLEGLWYLHKERIVHGDVKPHNMLLGSDGVCKLTDFGSAVLSEGTVEGEEEGGFALRGTAVYVAPEVAAGGECTRASDMFSLGVSMLELLTGELPWRFTKRLPADSVYRDMRALLRRDEYFVSYLSRGYVEVYIPPALGTTDLQEVLRACCQVNPTRRPTARNLLSFPYFLK